MKYISKKTSSKLRNLNLTAMNRFTKITSAIAVFILTTPIWILAQPTLPGNPSQAPIDGGLMLLAAGGGAYAIKKLREKRKE